MRRAEAVNGFRRVCLEVQREQTVPTMRQKGNSHQKNQKQQQQQKNHGTEWSELWYHLSAFVYMQQELMIKNMFLSVFQYWLWFWDIFL